MSSKIMCVNPKGKEKKMGKSKKHKGLGGGFGKVSILPSGKMLSHVIADLFTILIGVLVGAFAAHKWSKEGKGTAIGAWSGWSYALAIGGGWAAGLIASFLVKGKEGAKYAYHGLVGGALLASYQFLTKNVAAKSPAVAAAIGGVGDCGLGWQNTPIGGVFKYPAGHVKAGRQFQRVGADEWKEIGAVIDKRELGVVMDKNELGAVMDKNELGAVVDLNARRSVGQDTIEMVRDPYKDAFQYAGFGGLGMF